MSDDWYAVQATQCIRGLSSWGFGDAHTARIFRAYAAGAPAAATKRPVAAQDQQSSTRTPPSKPGAERGVQ